MTKKTECVYNRLKKRERELKRDADFVCHRDMLQYCIDITPNNI